VEIVQYAEVKCVEIYLLLPVLKMCVLMV